MTTTTTSQADGSPCDFHCGYVSSGRDLWEHVFNEHRPCPECHAGPGQDLCTYSLSHKLDCPRLKPGYVYPPIDGYSGPED